MRLEIFLNGAEFGFATVRRSTDAVRSIECIIVMAT